MQRRDKLNYYLDIAEVVGTRSTCHHVRCGAILVKNDEILATGYLGAPRGRRNCIDMTYCRRDLHKQPCRAVHAEENAILSASRSQTLGATLYVVCSDAKTGEYLSGKAECKLCKALIINAGIRSVILRETRDTFRAIDVESEFIVNDDTLE